MTNIVNYITELAAYINTSNQYFDKFFDFAEQDDTIGVINNGQERVFPSDTFGNYFYLRYPDGLGFNYSNSFNISDTGGSIGIRYDLVLVACVQDADSGLLLQNLISTIGAKCGEYITFTNAKFAEHAIIQELKKVKDKKDVEAALKNLPNNMTVVALSFTIILPFVYIPVRCIQTPCKTC